MARESPIIEPQLARGEDKSVVWTIYQSDGTTAQNITGWTMAMYIAVSPTATANLLTKTVALTTPASGICTATLTAAETEALSGQGYYYGLWRTDTGSVTLLAFGAVALTVAPSP